MVHISAPLYLQKENELLSFGYKICAYKIYSFKKKTGSSQYINV